LAREKELRYEIRRKAGEGGGGGGGGGTAGERRVGGFRGGRKAWAQRRRRTPGAEHAGDRAFRDTGSGKPAGSYKWFFLRCPPTRPRTPCHGVLEPELAREKELRYEIRRKAGEGGGGGGGGGGGTAGERRVGAPSVRSYALGSEAPENPGVEQAGGPGRSETPGDGTGRFVPTFFLRFPPTRPRTPCHGVEKPASAWEQAPTAELPHAPALDALHRRPYLCAP
jgi:hypothetical protein